MSGFSPKTGLFELTSTKEKFWFRLPIDQWPQSCFDDNGSLLPDVDVVLEILKRAGLEQVKRGSSYRIIRATPEQLWEALSGKPSDPVVAARHWQAGKNRDERNDLIEQLEFGKSKKKR